MFYGWALERIIHFIVALRNHYPKVRILISKYDLSDAYRRLAYSPKAEAETTLVVGKMLIFLAGDLLVAA